PQLDLGADLGHAHREVVTGWREIDAARAAVVLILSPLDQAATFQTVEQTYQRRALDAERGRQFLLAHTAAQAADISERPPCRVGQAEGAQLGIDCLPQTPGEAGDVEAKVDLPGARHG